MKESIVVGIVGENGAGKDSFAESLKAITSDFDPVSMHRFSDPIVETADIWGIEKTRENLQALPIVIEERFGRGLLAATVEKRALLDRAWVVILNGMRWPADLEMLYRFPKNFLVYVTASQETRYVRMRERKEKAGEDAMSFEEFLRREMALNEVSIQTIGVEADWKYVNEQSLNELKLAAGNFYLERLYPLLFGKR